MLEINKEQIIQQLDRIISQEPLPLNIKKVEISKIIDDKILHIRGWVDGKNDNIDANKEIDHRIEHYQGEKMLTAAKRAINDSIEKTDASFKSFMRFLKMKLENPEENVENNFSAEDLYEFDKIMNGTSDKYVITDLSNFIVNVFWIQLFANDGYYNGGYFIKFLNKAKEKAKNPLISDEALEYLNQITADDELLKESYKKARYYAQDIYILSEDLTRYYSDQAFNCRRYQDLKSRIAYLSRVKELPVSTETIESLIKMLPKNKELEDIINILKTLKTELSKKGLFKSQRKINQIIEMYEKLLNEKISKLQEEKDRLESEAKQNNVDLNSGDYYNDLVNKIKNLMRKIISRPEGIEDLKREDPIRMAIYGDGRGPMGRNPMETFYHKEVEDHPYETAYINQKYIKDIAPIRNYDFNHIAPEEIPSQEEYIPLLEESLSRLYFSTIFSKHKNVISRAIMLINYGTAQEKTDGTEVLPPGHSKK